MGKFLDRFESTGMAHPQDPENPDTSLGFRVAVSDEGAAILEDALVFYGQFAEQNAANPRLQRDTANAHRRVGEIYERLGDYDKAETAYRRAIEICLRQSRQAAGPDVTLLMASTFNQLGHVEMILGRLEEGRVHFNQARQVLATRVDDSPQCQYELAHTHGNLGSVLWYLQRGPAAVHNDRQAIELLKQLVSEYPEQAEYRLALARAYRRYHPPAGVSRDGNTREWFRAEAVSIIRELAAEYPTVPDYRCELSETLATVSFESIVFKGRGFQEFQLRRAVGLAKGITDEYPEIPRYRGALARSKKDLARLLLDTNRSNEAESLAAAAVVLYEDLWSEFPDVRAYQFFLASALHAHGDILRDIDRLSESRQAIQRAIEEQESYLAASPNAAFGNSMLALYYDGLAATLTALEADKEAAEAVRRAEEIRGR